MRPLFKVPIKYGVIAGVLGFILLIVLYYLNRHPMLIEVYFDFRIFLFGVFIFFALKEVRDYYQQGELYFSQGVIGSFIFVATFAWVACLLMVLFIAIVPEFLTDYVNFLTTRLKQLSPEEVERIGKETVERNLQALPSTNAFGLASLYFVQSFLIGLFVSIIMSTILRRQPKN